MTTARSARPLAAMAAAAQDGIDVGVGGVARLRQPATGDAARFVLAGNDPEIQRWTELPGPYDHSHAMDFIERLAPQGLIDGSLVAFTVVDDDDDVLGVVSLHRIDEADATADVGFWIAPWARRHGAAGIALRALAEWGFEAAGLRRLRWRAVVGNVPSLRAATSAGFVPEGTRIGRLRHRWEFVDCWEATLAATDPRQPHEARQRCSVEIAAGVWQLQPITAAPDACAAELALPVSACLPVGLWAVRDAVDGHAVAVSALLTAEERGWVLTAGLPVADGETVDAAVRAGTAAIERYARFALELQLP